MLKANMPFHKTAKDLKAGDIALIQYVDRTHLVYVFNQNNDTNIRSMVALDANGVFWSTINGNTLNVIKTFKSGEMIEVSNE